MFSNDAIKKFNLLASAKTPAERLRRGITVAASAVIAALVRSAVNTSAEELGYAVGGGERPRDDAERRVTNAAWDFLDNIGGLVYGGGQAVRGMRKLATGQAYNPLDVPADRIVTDFGRHTKDLIAAVVKDPPKNDLKPRTRLDRLMTALGNMAHDTVMLTGVPTTPGVRVAERFGRSAGFDIKDQFAEELAELRRKHREELAAKKEALRPAAVRAAGALESYKTARMSAEDSARLRRMERLSDQIAALRKRVADGRTKPEDADRIIDGLVRQAYRK
jgi:hypothetical protein